MPIPKIIIQTIIISLAFFFILFIVSSENFFMNQPKFKLEPMHLFIALIPFLILLIVSGKLKEIKGPGGIGLSLRDEVQKPVSPELIDMQLEVDPAIVEKKGGVQGLLDRIAQNPPTALSFEIERKNYYGQWAIEEYINELERHPNFRFILFVDKKGKFKGCIKVGDYRTILETHDVVGELESGQILENPRVIKNSVKITSSNKQVLNMMDRLNTTILPVVDQEGNFIGVVTQEEIVRKILTKVLREI